MAAGAGEDPPNALSARRLQSNQAATRQQPGKNARPPRRRTSTTMQYEEFASRVEREQASADRASAERDAQAVVAALLDAVTGRESDDLLAHLTGDYEALLGMVDSEEVWGPGWRDRLGEAG